MKIFYSFLIIVCSTILILLPVTAGIYDFRTDVREDYLTATTGVGESSDNVTLQKLVYDDDSTTISVYSSDSGDVPIMTAFDATSHSVVFSGLTANTSRTLTVSYDVAAFTEGGLTAFLNILPYIWILIWVAFPIAALVAIWMGKA